MQQEPQLVKANINVAELICIDNYLNKVLNPVFIKLELNLQEEVAQIVKKILNSIKQTFKVDIQDQQLYLYPSGFNIMLKNQLKSNCFIIHQLQYQSELYLLLSKKYQESKQFSLLKQQTIPLNKIDFFNSSDCSTTYCIEISGNQVPDQSRYFNYIFNNNYENHQAITYHFTLMNRGQQLTEQYSIHSTLYQSVACKIRFQKYRICDLPLTSILLIRVLYKQASQNIKIPIFNDDFYLNQDFKCVDDFGKTLVISFQRFLKPIKCDFQEPKLLNHNLKQFSEVSYIDVIKLIDGYDIHSDAVLEQMLSNLSLLHCIILLSPKFPISFNIIAYRQFIKFQNYQIVPFIPLLLKYLYKQSNEQLEQYLIQQSLNDIYFGQQVFWQIQYMIQFKQNKSNLINISEILLLNVNGLQQQQQTKFEFNNINIKNHNEFKIYIKDREKCISFPAQNNLQFKRILDDIINLKIAQPNFIQFNLSNYIDMPTVNSIPIKLKNSLKSYLDYVLELYKQEEFNQSFIHFMSEKFQEYKYQTYEIQQLLYITFVNQIFLDNGMNYYLIVNEHICTSAEFTNLKGQYIIQLQIEHSNQFGKWLMDINQKSKDNKLLKSYAGYIILVHLFELRCLSKYAIITDNGILQFVRLRNYEKYGVAVNRDYFQIHQLNEMIIKNNLYQYFSQLIVKGITILRQQKSIDLLKLLMYITNNQYDLNRFEDQLLETNIDLLSILVHPKRQQ